MGHRSQTHCLHGHEFTPANTLWVNRKSGARDRRCRTCKAESDKTWRVYKRDAKDDGPNRKRIKSMRVKLTWNECRPGEEWQAGGLGSHFSIIKNDSGSYAIRRAIGDEPSRFAGMAKTLEGAQQLCEHTVNKSC